MTSEEDTIAIFLSYKIEDYIATKVTLQKKHADACFLFILK